MPFNPASTGAQLKAAGKQQLQVAARLKSSADFLDTAVKELAPRGQVVGSLSDVEAGTRSTRDLVGLPVPALRTIATTLDGIRIPTVAVNSRNINIPVIGRIRIVTGVTLGSTRPFRSVATSLRGVANDLSNVRVALLRVADAMAQLQDRMPEIRLGITRSANDLRNASKAMTSSGTAMIDAGTLMGA